ncbi:MAG TPA: hypothetical protein VN089_05480 [Duganella sp.]|nr:hypothetical protein [Duganella sp.]
MPIQFTRTKTAIGLAAFCLSAAFSMAAQAQSKPMSDKDVVQPTGSTGATAFQPKGAAKGEAEANTGAQNGNAGMQQPTGKPGFDNKPPKGAKADCHRPQGGVDASGGENISTAHKDNTTCTSRPARKKDGK